MIEKMGDTLLVLKKERRRKRKFGAFFTPTNLAERLTQQAIQRYLLTSINRTFKQNFTQLYHIFDSGKERFYHFLYEALKSLRILDCASGEGEFLIASFKYLGELLTQITKNLQDRGFLQNEDLNFNFANNIYGMELDEITLKTCKDKIEKELLKEGGEDQSTIINQNIIHGNFLKSNLSSWTSISEGFNIIIGNPPWGSNISKAERDYFFAEFSIEGNKRNLNSFELFVYKSTQYLKQREGIIAFYLPKNFVRSNQYSNLRKFILEQYEIQSLHFYDLFQDVTQEFISIVGICRKAVNMNHKILINDSNLISQRKYYTNIDYIFTKKITNLELGLISLIKEQDFQLSHYVNIKRGEELSKKGGILLCPKCQRWSPLSSRKENIECSICNSIIKKEELETRNLISKSRSSKHLIPILTGDDFNRYQIEGSHYFDDSIEFRSKKTKKIYKSPKLVLQKIKSFPCAAYDDNNTVTTQNVYNITLQDDFRKKEDLLLFILAVLNSSLIYWFYDSQFNLGSKYTNAISIRNLKRLPIPPPEQKNEIYTRIVSNVKILLEVDSSQTKDILPEINRLVINSYGCESYNEVIDSILSDYDIAN
jgi:predicted RNA methylase